MVCSCNSCFIVYLIDILSLRMILNKQKHVGILKFSL